MTAIPEYPGEGVSPASLFMAIAAIEADQEDTDKRILSIVVRGNGILVVTTGVRYGGEEGRGDELVLKRSGTAWQIVERYQWIS
jgi:hypothetical protein